MYKKTHKNLLKWYKENGRHHLPWRQTDSAYEIWVSEIMLQQTQVKTVLEKFYFPFLEAFPTLQDLASASEDEVLKKWEGLGYYTRARNLHKSAQLCETSLPLHVEDLMALAGIGKSTAHAIAAFAYKSEVPILDANVKRILYRVYGVKKANEKELWSLAYKLFDKKHPYEYNQAMMDIGSMICTRSKPTCKACPFESICVASDDNPLLYPEKKVKKKVPLEYKNMMIYQHENKLGMYRRTERFLQGLYSFVQVDRDTYIESESLGNVKHQYSHFHIDVEVYILESKRDDLEYFTIEEIKNLAISKVDEKALELLSY